VAEQKTVISSLAALKDSVGLCLGPTDWVLVSQERIDAFAEVTGDTQWIHVDPQRAGRESPWKTTIAHGYLTLSLVPHLLGRILWIEGVGSAVNTGLDRLRLSAPVPSGSRVRLHAEIKDARNMPRGGVRVTFAIRFEVEGGAKPAMTANVTYVYFP
jgi:acyl dehydratase